jgi:hypothetical protein
LICKLPILGKEVLQQNSSFCYNTIYLKGCTVMMCTMLSHIWNAGCTFTSLLLAFIPLWMFSDISHTFNPHTHQLNYNALYFSITTAEQEQIKAGFHKGFPSLS